MSSVSIQLSHLAPPFCRKTGTTLAFTLTLRCSGEGKCLLDFIVSHHKLQKFSRMALFLPLRFQRKAKFVWGAEGRREEAVSHKPKLLKKDPIPHNRNAPNVNKQTATLTTKVNYQQNLNYPMSNTNSKF